MSRAPGTLRAALAVVTGASRGVGLAVALALAAEGATVVATARDVTPVREASTAPVSEEPRSGRLLPVAADVQDPAAHADLAARVQRAGGLDVLVHAAGHLVVGDAAGVDAADVAQVMGVNVTGPIGLTAALVPALVRRGGHVVFVNSSQGLDARAGTAAYAASKHALRGYADALRQELNPLGVRVTSLYLGRTATAMTAALYPEADWVAVRDGLLQPADVAEAVLGVLALPRRAEVTDLTLRPSAPAPLPDPRAGGPPSPVLLPSSPPPEPQETPR